MIDLSDEMQSYITSGSETFNGFAFQWLIVDLTQVPSHVLETLRVVQSQVDNRASVTNHYNMWVDINIVENCKKFLHCSQFLETPDLPDEGVFETSLNQSAYTETFEGFGYYDGQYISGCGTLSITLSGFDQDFVSVTSASR